MPFSVKFLKNCGVIAEVSGTFTPADHTQMQGEIYGSPPNNLNNISFVIADCSKITETTHSSDDLKRLAGFNKTVFTLKPDLHLAIVMPGDQNFGLARIWRAWLGEKEPNSMIFRSRKEAEDWIGEVSGRKDLKFE